MNGAHPPGAYTFGNAHGFFGIIWQRGRWVAMWEEEPLGSYATPGQALEDLAGGHCYSPSNGLDTSRAGLPDELSGWSWKVFRSS